MDFIVIFIAIVSAFGFVVFFVNRRHQNRALKSEDNVTAATDDAGETPTARPADSKIVPVSVNYHFTRKCNYQCGFCFHTAKTSYVLPLETAKHGLKMLKEAGNVIFAVCSDFLNFGKGS